MRILKAYVSSTLNIAVAKVELSAGEAHNISFTPGVFNRSTSATVAVSFGDNTVTGDDFSEDVPAASWWPTQDVDYSTTKMSIVGNTNDTGYYCFTAPEFHTFNEPQLIILAESESTTITQGNTVVALGHLYKVNGTQYRGTRVFMLEDNDAEFLAEADLKLVSVKVAENEIIEDPDPEIPPA